MSRPEPPVPAEVDLNGLPFMPLEHARLLQSTLFAKSTGDEFKAALALWCAAWLEVPAASLPDDEEMLEYLARTRAGVWEKVRARALHGWILCSDGRLYHGTLARLALDAWDRREDWREVQHNKNERQERWRQRCKELGEQLRGLGVTPPRGAGIEKLEALLRQARETKPLSTSKRDVDARVDAAEIALKRSEVKGREEKGPPVGPASASASLDFGDDPLPDPAQDSPDRGADAPPTKAQRATRLEASWQLPKAWGEWALREYEPVWTPDKVRLEADKFRDHWVGKGGKDATKTDWLATWRNWCRSPLAHRDDPKPLTGGGAMATAQRNAEARRRLGFTPAGPAQEVIDG